jgi:hypothetical protein
MEEEKKGWGQEFISIWSHLILYQTKPNGICLLDGQAKTNPTYPLPPPKKNQKNHQIIYHN